MASLTLYFSGPVVNSRKSARRGRVVLWGVVLLAIVGAVVCADWYSAKPQDVERSYVGRQRCIECHAKEGSTWEGSHHDLAMDLATPDKVIGDFDNQIVEHHGITTRLFRDGDRYMVNAEGPDGEMHDYHVKYVFGVDPLQQYMVELESPTPGVKDAVGRVQVLRTSWDTKRKRWFYLDPPDVDDKLAPSDPLHWTGSAQNWNHMCADCHSTDLQKNFNVDSLTYGTTFSEIDVSCEACHGPGSLHADLADDRSLFWDRRHGLGLAKMKNADADVQIQVCSKCHSRRGLVQPDFVCGKDYYDHYNNELLNPETYYADGQIRDEVYVMGSFLQSKMYAKGIRCTDCHDPHTANLKHEGNKVCTSCHQHSAGKYDTPAHHHHPVGSTGASCVECHMMETVYMNVDERRDHSFQIPRPDRSVAIQTPNACTKCHVEPKNVAEEKRGGLEYYADWLQAARDGDEQVAKELARANAWAADYTKQWYGDKADPAPRVEFAHTLHRAWNNDPGVLEELLGLAEDRRVSAMVRASAVSRLNNFPFEKTRAVAAKALKDRDPLVRAAGISVFHGNNVAPFVRELGPLLEDPTRFVRIQAALALAGLPLNTISRERREAMDRSLEEHLVALKVNSDLTGSHMARALLAESFQDWRSAEQAYRDAIRVMPGVTGPRSNLVAILEREQRVEEAQELRKQELALMKRDAGLAPDNAWLQYRLGLAMYRENDLAEAETTLRRAMELEPNVADFTLAVTLLYKKQERWSDAVSLCERLLELDANRGNQQLYGELRMALQQSQQVGPAAP